MAMVHLLIINDKDDSPIISMVIFQFANTLPKGAWHMAEENKDQFLGFSKIGW